MRRLIFHVDVNSAFLSWEAARRVKNGEPDLRLIPSAIGGERDKRTGVILAKSIPAKKYGVTTGEPVALALRKCPVLVLAKPDFQLYMHESRAFIDICRRFAPVVEQMSIDECFLDMTGTSLLYPDPVAIAHTIKDTIRAELGFTVNVGVSTNKLLAKMAGDFEKPDKVHTLFPNEIEQKLWPLPVGDLFSVGRRTAEKLLNARIRTIGELAHADPALVQKLAGVKLGTLIRDYANGVDPSPVLAEPEAVKGYGNSVTLEQDVVTAAQAARVLLALCDSVASRMRADSRRCLCVTVTIRGNDFKNRSHQRRLPEPTDVTRELYAHARTLFSELWDGHTPLRLLGVTLGDVCDAEAVQISLFHDEQTEKSRRLDRAVDELRSKFGVSAISRGSVSEASQRLGRKYRAQPGGPSARPDPTQIKGE